MAIVSSLVTEIAQPALEHGYSKILIDVRELDGLLSGLSSYKVVTEDFQRLRGLGLKKAAIVDRPLPNLRIRLFELVARNRGFNLKVFDDPEKALDWLLGRD